MGSRVAQKTAGKHKVARNNHHAEQDWTRFLVKHVKRIASVGFFTALMLSFRVLDVFGFLRLIVCLSELTAIL